LFLEVQILKQLLCGFPQVQKLQDLWLRACATEDNCPRIRNKTVW